MGDIIKSADAAIPCNAHYCFCEPGDEYYVNALHEYGVKGYVWRSSDEHTLIAAIRTVYNGAEYLDNGVWEIITRVKRWKKKSPILTRREREILTLIANSYNSEDIARKLFLSKRTVDNHRYNLLSKLQVRNSASLIKRAIQLGLINPLTGE